MHMCNTVPSEPRRDDSSRIRNDGSTDRYALGYWGVDIILAIAAALGVAVALHGQTTRTSDLPQSQGTYLIFRVEPDVAGSARGTTPGTRRVTKDVVTGVQDIIKRRLVELGIANPVVTNYGETGDQLYVLLPAGVDVTRAKAIIRNTARLEFKIVENTGTDESSVLASYGGKAPDGMEVVRSASGTTGNSPRTYYLVRRAAILTNRDIQTARPVTDELKLPAVNITLTTDAVATFSRVTGENVGRELAIVLDGLVQSAPRIVGRVAGTDVRITGSFTRREVDDLCVVLRTGALPASLALMAEGIKK